MRSEQQLTASAFLGRLPHQRGAPAKLVGIIYNALDEQTAIARASLILSAVEAWGKARVEASARLENPS